MAAKKPNRRASSPQTTSSRSPKPQSKPSAASGKPRPKPTSGVYAAAEREIPLPQIDPPRFSSRESLDETALEQLADSITEQGLLHAVIVRPTGKKDRFEIVAGERRWRASRIAGLKTIRCSIRDLDDRQAAEIRLLENLDRADLNPIEESRALQHLKDLGHTAESLSKVTRMLESEIVDRIGLLKLTPEWQDRIRSRELTPAAAGYLIPFAKFPVILDAMEKAFKRWPMSLVDWKGHLAEAVMLHSRSMEKNDPLGPRFEVTPEIEAELQVIAFEPRPGDVRRRAMNAALWDKLQDEFDSLARRSPSVANVAPGRSAAGRTAGGSAAGYVRSNGRPSIHRDRGTTTTLPVRPGETNEDEWDEGDIEPGEPLTDEQFAGRVRHYERGRLCELLGPALERATVEQLDAACAIFDIEPLSEWRINAQFLGLHDRARLEQLAAEFGIDLSACRTIAESIAVFNFEDPLQVPSVIAALHESVPVAPAPVAVGA